MAFGNQYSTLSESPSLSGADHGAPVRLGRQLAARDSHLGQCEVPIALWRTLRDVAGRGGAMNDRLALEPILRRLRDFQCRTVEYVFRSAGAEIVGCAELIEHWSMGRINFCRGQFKRYRELELANGRMRALMDKTVGAGHWQLLWCAFPSVLVAGGSLSEPAGDDEVSGFLGVAGGSRRHRRFLPGMPVISLAYRSPTLARATDPIAIAVQLGASGPPSIDQGKEQVGDQIASLLQQTDHWPAANEGREDQRWYWAAWRFWTLDSRRG